eukprot:SAG31_NODE_1489_length_8135_cov_3.382558_8_plen_83_part_00
MDLELHTRSGGERSRIHQLKPSISMAHRAHAYSLGVVVGDALDAALENLSEFSTSMRELGRYAQNLGKERTWSRADIVNLAR